MSGPRFDEVEQQVIYLYARRDYHSALRALHGAAPYLGAQWERVAYWRACLLARLGQTGAAVETLTQAVDAGAWWSPRLLETESDLDPLHDDPRYRELLRVMHRRSLEWRPSTTGLYVAGTPGGWPFLGLHGRNQIYEVDAAHIAGSLGGGWEIAVPESRQRIASDGPVWDDAGACHRQVMELADFLWEDRPFVVGGFSQGGRRALQVALAAGGRVPAVLAVAPMLLRSREIAEVLESLGPPPWPLVLTVVGSRDPGLDGATAVTEHLQEEGVEAIMEIVPGAGHRWLQPSSGALNAAAERLAAPTPWGRNT